MNEKKIKAIRKYVKSLYHNIPDVGYVRVKSGEKAVFTGLNEKGEEVYKKVPTFSIQLKTECKKYKIKTLKEKYKFCSIADLVI